MIRYGPIETTNTGLDITKYKVTYEDTVDKATIFKTNSSGKIVINNLEIYSAKDTKYSYWVYEVSNDNYGYNNVTIGKIEVTDGEKIDAGEGYERWARFEITASTTVKITNTKELGKLTIHKVGENNTNLVGVEFVVWQEVSTNKGYLKLDTVTKPIETQNTGLDITKYTVTYVSNIEEATKFKTNSSGKIVINNLEIYSAPDTKYNYWVQEVSNSNYGYKHMLMTEEDVTVTRGEKLAVRTNTNEVKNTLTSDTIVKIKNTPYLGSIQLIKLDKDNNSIKLANVEFKLTVNGNKYIQLVKNGGPVPSKTGTINIKDGYTVQYTDDSDQATIFVTDSLGNLLIQNLEVYSAKGSKYTYKLHEISNENYGYTIYSSNIENENIQLSNGQVQNITAVNEKELGGISITKVDKQYNNIILEDVEFVLSIDKEPNTYIALYKGEEIERTAKGTSTINTTNISNKEEYEVKYVKLDKPYLEYTENERKNLDITRFITDENAEILINNLEVKNNIENKNYTYRLTEIYNPYYGYEEITGEQYYQTTLTKGKISYCTIEQIANSQPKMRISGYVWLENPTGKANGYDNIYEVNDDNAEDKDIRMTDLYITKKGQLILNEKPKYLKEPIEIKLRNKDTGDIVKELPDEYDENGRYTFNGIDVENLLNYEVVFVYNGFYYTTITENLNEDNGSKVKEISSERTNLNNKFGAVTENGQLVSIDEKTSETIKYNEETLKQSVFDSFETKGFASISASTSDTGYNLADKLNDLKTNTTRPVERIDNVNMGIVLREQPKISVANDIHNILVNFEGYEYNYIYNARKTYSSVPYDEDQEVGVKFDEEKNTRYTRTLYTSDVQAVEKYNKEMNVSVTYKIQIANKSTTLTVMPKEIMNYFDARYTIKSIGLGTVQNNKIILDKELEYSDPSIVEGHPEYKSTIIKCEEQILSSQSKYIFITFEVDSGAILDLLKEKSTYHNATEIMKYSTYYGQRTGKAEAKYFISDHTAVDAIYSGIDKTSQPGNIEIKLVDHQSGDGTQVLDTSEFEDDTSSAPSLLLEVGEREVGVRRISGSVWEDIDANTNDSENKGNGILDSQEKPISNVKLELRIVNPNGTIGDIAKYSNEQPAITQTDENGKYTFGYYKEENGQKTYAGVLPGKYVIKYTYNNESYIVGKEAINVNDYKSTIITSDVIKAAIDNQTITYKGEEYSTQRWYTIQENNRYSDAVDNFELRQNLEKNEVNYSNYQNSSKPEYVMDAYTPLMDIGVEFTPKDSEKATYTEDGEIIKTKHFTTELVNVDFGIIERPNVEIIPEKEITSLEIIAQNGTNIIPEGNPSDESTKMEGVKKLEGFISAEIEKNRLQGAELNLEYTITIHNTSETDYSSKSYYYYGTPDNNEKPREIKNVVLADYLEGSMVIDEEKTAEGGTQWKKETADYLKNEGLVSKEVYEELKAGDYTILISKIEEIDPGETQTFKLYTTKYLAVSDSIEETNSTEIIELEGGRTIKESIPGNNVPGDPPSDPDPEPDGSTVVFVITPPTGTIVNYTPYIVAVPAMLTILVLGIVIIKKKVVK